MKTKIRGKIIRILDNRTVIVNLGKNDGISTSSIFLILGDEEAIVDPFNNRELGSIKVVKSKLSPKQIDDYFTIATTKWTYTALSFNKNSLLGTLSAFTSNMETVSYDHDEGELNVDPNDIKPWKALKDEPVKVGDNVEVEIDKV